MRFNKILLTLCVAVATTVAIQAQNKTIKAPNYFWANPDEYTHRVVEVQDYENIDSLKYDAEGYLVRRNVHTVEYEYDEDGNITSKKVGKEPYGWDKYLYDENHYVAEILECRPGQEGSDIPEVVVGKHTFDRDANGFIQTTIQFNKDTQDPDAVELTIFQRFRYTYDEQGHIIGCINEAYDRTTEEWNFVKECRIQYDGKGRILKLAWTIENDPVWTEDFTYNEKGQMTHILFVNDKGDQLDYNFTWDEAGNCTHTGRDQFPYRIVYNTELLRKNTYIPRQEFGVGSGQKYLDAATEFFQIPWKMTKNVPATMYDLNDELYKTISYEKNNAIKPTATIEVANHEKQFSASHDAQAIHLHTANIARGTKILVYSAQGELLHSTPVNGSEVVLLRNSFPKGLLLFVINGQTVKLQN